MTIVNKLYGTGRTGTNIITTLHYTIGSMISNSLSTIIATGFYK